MNLLFFRAPCSWMLGLIASICLLSPSLLSAQNGKIMGKITYEGRNTQLKAVNMANFPDCEAMNPKGSNSNILLIGRGNTLANVLVRVKNPPKSIAVPVPSTSVVIDQTGCFFSPRLTAVQKGQPLKFKNSDGILHNVHGFPKANNGFNIGMPPSSVSKTMKFSQAEGPFKVKCDVHPWMNAYVAVMTHPYFAVTSEKGAFEIKGLPPGTYDVEAWHEKLGTQSKKVTVGKQSAVANLSFK